MANPRSDGSYLQTILALCPNIESLSLMNQSIISTLHVIQALPAPGVVQQITITRIVGPRLAPFAAELDAYLDDKSVFPALRQVTLEFAKEPEDGYEALFPALSRSGRLVVEPYLPLKNPCGLS